MPSIDQIMPWLHLIFDAWEDYKKTREHEAQTAAAMAAEIGDDEDGGKKKKKHKRHKHKDRK